MIRPAALACASTANPERGAWFPFSVEIFDLWEPGSGPRFSVPGGRFSTGASNVEWKNPTSDRCLHGRKRHRRRGAILGRQQFVAGRELEHFAGDSLPRQVDGPAAAEIRQFGVVFRLELWLVQRIEQQLDHGQRRQLQQQSVVERQHGIEHRRFQSAALLSEALFCERVVAPPGPLLLPRASC